MPHVLVIEDDADVRRGLLRSLTECAFATSSAATGLAGLEAVVAGAPDLIVLDLGLPDIEGKDILRMIRAVSEVPVVVATARDDEREIVAVLNAGADDYLIKPFGGDQLVARVRAVLRRGASKPAGPQATITVGQLVLDRSRRTVELAGQPLSLAPKEFELLSYLCERVGEVVTKRELLSEVWQLPYSAADKTVDVHLSWLRRKLGESGQTPRYLHTVRGVGLRLDEPV
ncbi:MAG: response regulator transcription factor [Pseudonocardiales bacterium]|nr:response regulator transcription factor [Pseudonocardiales bacterium]